jgi:hypothetical protein
VQVLLPVVVCCWVPYLPAIPITFAHLAMPSSHYDMRSLKAAGLAQHVSQCLHQLTRTRGSLLSLQVSPSPVWYAWSAIWYACCMLVGHPTTGVVGCSSLSPSNTRTVVPPEKP